MKKIYKRPPEIKANSLATDYRDQTYGKLTVLYPTRREKFHLLWLAKCECGTEVEVRAHQLANCVVGSCGKCEHLPGIHEATLPREIPYSLEPEAGDLVGAFGGMRNVQGELDLTDPELPGEAEMNDLVGEDWPIAPITTPLSQELTAIEACCSALDSIPVDTHNRVFQYLRSRFAEVH